MSAPPDRHGRPIPTPTTPRPALQERSQSQNNRLAIRIVPYTPPRLVSGERPPSQLSSHSRYAEEGSSGSYDTYEDQESTNLAGPSRPRAYDRVEDYAGRRGSALSYESTPPLRLARAKDDGVSGAKQAPEGQGFEAQLTPQSPRATPVLRVPSEVGPSNNTSLINAPASPRQLESAHQDKQPYSSVSAASSTEHLPHTQRPLSRRTNFVTVHPDKTFSLVKLRPTNTTKSDVSGSLKSPRLTSASYSTSTSGSHERPSIDAWSNYRSSSPPLSDTSATIPDHALSELPLSTPYPGTSTGQLTEEPISSSPWNYKLVGGLRKVPTTPDPKEKQPLYNTTSSSPADILPPLPEITVYRDEEDKASKTLEPKASFASAETTSSTSERTNYKVYGRSPAPESTESLALLASSSPSNYEILGESSPAVPFDNSPPGTSDSNENYILHGDPSPSNALVANRKQPRPSYSQESLTVPPLSLGPSRKRSNEKLGYYKQRSRENLRARAESFKSINKSSTNISSIIGNQGVTQVFAANPVFTNFQGRPISRQEGERSHNNHPPAESRDPWSSIRQAGGSLTTGSSSVHPLPPIPMVPEHTHVWSSQLSTVMSESEGSTGAFSRPVSPSTGHGIPLHHRRSSTGWASSMHSRHLQSISSLAGTLEEATSGSRGSASQSEYVERPRPTQSRTGLSGFRTVRDQDEHGDGITDLYDTSNQASRSGLSGFFSSSNSSSRNLHSSASSTKANSFTAASLPAWARVYYGSGERARLPRMASLSTLTDSVGGDSRPTSSAFQSSGSPNTDHFPLSIYSPRRRAKEVHPPRDQRPFSDSGSMAIAPATPTRGMDFGVVRTLRRKTSSVWSPHLQTDRRATNRYSIWEPPSVAWSADSGMLGKRNAQVVMFAVGFIFPFAWMIAALLPLPLNPKLEMLERRDMSQTNFGSGQINFSRRMLVTDQRRYESALWWRNVNRIMSIAGLIVIGAVVALVVVGIKQGWMLTNH